MRTDYRFYCVCNPDGHPPRQGYSEHRLAVEEAERLAKQQPGQTFFVLLACGFVRSAVASVYTELEPEPILRGGEPIAQG